VKTFDWADLLDHHPIFSALNDEEVRWLLQDEVSKERSYAAGTAIIHAGEVGDSILLIGAGSLDAVLPLDGGKQTNLSVMRKGEVFGEMGFFEDRPRSATVIAREACMLLEIGGRDFRKTLEAHPEIEVKLLLTVSERLRNANEQLLNLHLHGMDEKLQLFNAKLDVEHRIVDISLRAAQTVFDQTRQRADEVISSFERTRGLLQITATVIGTIVTLLVSGLGYFGYNELKSIRDMGKEVRADADLVKTDMKTVHNATQDLENIRRQLDETKKVMSELLSSMFNNAVSDQDIPVAREVHVRLRGLREPNEPMPEALLTYVELRMTRPSSGAPVDWRQLLELMAQDAKAARTDASRTDAALMDSQESRAYYLLLANCLLAKPNEFEAALTKFGEVVAQQKRRGVKADGIDKEMLERLASFVTRTDPAKSQSFKKVRDLAMSP
jgi:CRP-like cAMP-binding protein